jgi:DNA segregation ATPase FtsK/SpoIIIE, S-DNA-T family
VTKPRRTTVSRGTSSARRGRGVSALSPQLARSLLGIVLLVLGAVTLIALALPGQGILNQYVSDVLRPAFGQGAWLLPVLLLLAGVFVERAPNTGSGWGVTALGGLIAFLGGLGLIHLVWGQGTSEEALRNGGGWLGAQMSGYLSDLLSPPGAFVVLLGMVLAGVVMLFNLTVRGLLSSVTAPGRVIAGALTTGGDDGQAAPAAAGAAARNGRTPGRTAPGRAERPGETGSQPVLPPPVPNPLPMSQTVWSGERAGAVGGGAPGAAGTAAVAVGAAGAALSGVGGAAAAAGAAGALGPGGSVAIDETAGREPALPAERLLAAEDSPVPLHERPWVFPSAELLDQPQRGNGTVLIDHERNVRIIEEKLRSFQIPATVTGTNVGPVVTQYEVRPDVRVKLSRIEALADDLAMALAARSIRIEAPIPGKDVVGIEIPNHAAEVVGLRGLWDDARMTDATSRLTFALGRDVSGTAYAVDLAKMPHLLIAGATGSGKSVCVNALITSFLMRARPDEVRLILVDLKRVELSAYDGLPHLLTNVIIEPGDAKAALNWAVHQMEERYKALAARTERNITAYNASPRVAPEERLPYIVIIIDELADLMMREGRKVEDPIVRLAQKARAVGVHLVLATQRPSVNVVTGLIKANVPSRIAFAMASNVDSRTVLDAPGAEDLIGRGDMLYQPADLPRPVRLQGVFVSDREVLAVTDHWKAQAPEPQYDPEVLAAREGEGEGGGRFGWMAAFSEDDMTQQAAELVTTTGRASTSMLQTKLKIGFNRATRIMDELERCGVVGPQDPRNPAVPRMVYGPENWIRSLDDVDD